MKRGDSHVICNKENTIGIIQWFDRKIVTLASNFILRGTLDKVERYDKIEKKLIHISRPQVIQEYNKFMGGVDLFDQYMSYYRISYRTRKWTVKLINNAIDMAITLAYVEYKKDRGEYFDKQGLMEFRLTIVDEILRSFRPINIETRSMTRERETTKKVKVTILSQLQFWLFSFFLS